MPARIATRKFKIAEKVVPKEELRSAHHDRRLDALSSSALRSCLELVKTTRLKQNKKTSSTMNEHDQVRLEVVQDQLDVTEVREASLCRYIH